MAYPLLGVLPMIEQLFNDGAYAVSKQLMDLSVARHEVLAANIANAETPGYRRIDLAPDFAAKLQEQIRDGNVGQLSSKDIPFEVDRKAMSVRADGNTVQLDEELLKLSSNTLEFDVMSEFVSGSLKQLRMAITGRTTA